MDAFERDLIDWIGVDNICDCTTFDDAEENDLVSNYQEAKEFYERWEDPHCYDGVVEHLGRAGFDEDDAIMRTDRYLPHISEIIHYRTMRVVSIVCDKYSDGVSLPFEVGALEDYKDCKDKELRRKLKKILSRLGVESEEKDIEKLADAINKALPKPYRKWLAVYTEQEDWSDESKYSWCWYVKDSEDEEDDDE